MRVFRRVFIEIDKNGKKEILLPGYLYTYVFYT